MGKRICKNYFTYKCVCWSNESIKMKIAKKKWKTKKNYNLRQKHNIQKYNNIKINFYIVFFY